MHKFNKNTIPEEIVQDDERFQETAYLLLRAEELKEDELQHFFDTYHKDIAAHEFLKRKKSYYDYFEKIGRRNTKILNSSFLRYYVKDLEKRIAFPSGCRRKITHNIALIITEVILEASYISYQNLYKEKYVELFETTVEPEHLQDVFNRMIIEMLKPILKGESDSIDMRLYRRFNKYVRIHAQYLVELHQDNIDKQDKLQDIKKQAEEFAKNFIKNREEIIQQSLPKVVVKEYQMIDSLKKYVPLQKTIDIKAPIDYQESKKLLDKYSLVEEIPQVFQDKYHEYYDYQQNQLQDYYHRIKFTVKFLYSLKQTDDNARLMEYCECLFLDTDNIMRNASKNHLLEIEKVLDNSVDIVVQFTHLLAFSLWHVADEKQRERRLTAFIQIKDDILECDEVFKTLISDEIDNQDDKRRPHSLEDYLHITFSPRDAYFTIIVFSILVKIDNPVVTRRIKKIILEDYPDFNLQQMSQKLNASYESNSWNDNVKMFNQFADHFILSYLYNREYVASYSPMIRFFQQFYNYYYQNMKYCSPIVRNCLQQTYTKDLILQKTILQIHENYQHMIEEYQENKESLELPNVQQLEYLFRSTYRSQDYFCPYHNITQLYEKYKEEYIWYLIISHQSETFFKRSLHEQMDQFLCMGTLYRLISEIDVYTEFMPKTKQIKQEEHIQSLQQQIEEQQKIIEAKNQEIKSLTNYQHYYEDLKINQSQKFLKEEMQSYKQEAVTLNKQLSSKDKEISQLKDDLQELYKLRELIFSMQHNETVEKTQVVDLTSLINDKTIVIVGGSVSLRKKLKNKYPNFKMISQFSNHFNEDILFHADHVFMFYKYMAHDVYRKIVPILTHYHIPWDYIPYNNLKKSEKMIYDILSS